MLDSQRDGMPLQMLDAEQLSAQQLGIPVVTQRVPGAWRKSELFDCYDTLLVHIKRQQRRN